jgi:hypothetical protein
MRGSGQTKSAAQQLSAMWVRRGGRIANFWTVPSSVVQTGVKSPGCEKRIPQLSPQYSWIRSGPIVESASMLGKSSPSRIAIASSTAAGALQRGRFAANRNRRRRQPSPAGPWRPGQPFRIDENGRSQPLIVNPDSQPGRFTILVGFTCSFSRSPRCSSYRVATSGSCYLWGAVTSCNKTVTMRDIFNTNHTNANMHTYTRLRRLRAMALGVLQKLHRAHLSAPAHNTT